MIVGNGEVGARAHAAAQDADLVIRFNDCRSAGPGAARTDIVAVCNTGRPGLAMSTGEDWKSNPAVRAASQIWCVRDAEKFAEMRAPLAATHPELDDFCDDYTDGFRQFCMETGKACRVIPRSVHDGLDAAFAALAAAPYVVPSTGLVVIADVIVNHLEPGDRILLAGFSHEGWEWHPWDAERRHLAPYEAAGIVVRINETEFEKSLSGARG